MTRKLSCGTLQLAIFTLAACAAHAQSTAATAADVTFAGLSARTQAMAYQGRGGDMSAITPLLASTGNRYRDLTHAIVVMSGKPWTPDTELTAALDFVLASKLVGRDEKVTASAKFLFDAPAAANGPYKMQLDLLKADGTKELSIAPGIVLGDVAGKKTGDVVSTTFDPAVTGAGLHIIRATLVDGKGNSLFEYHRSFYSIADLGKRSSAVEAMLAALPDKNTGAAVTAQQAMESIATARTSYFAPGFQGLAGFVYSQMRGAGLGLTEAVDYPDALTRATALAAMLKNGKDPFATATGGIAMAYRSSFDNKLVPYRVYVPAKYDKSKKYPLIVLLHGAGGNETDFMDGYRGVYPKLAEERGYILASVNGRGPLSGYTKESGGEQDVIDVADLMQKHYNIDKSRVYLGGHSMGGGGTWRVGLLYADRWAALIPLAGSNPSALPGYQKQLEQPRKLPILMVCGVNDALVAVAGCRTIAEKTKEMKAPLKYNEYPNTDHLSVVPAAAKDVFDWLDAQRPLE